MRMGLNRQAIQPELKHFCAGRFVLLKHFKPQNKFLDALLLLQVLLEIYSQDARYLSAKRIKLLLIPFKPIAKSSEIAVNKFLVWWSLICKVENQLDQHYETILVPFLWFCFGSTEKSILSTAIDVSTRQEV